MMKYLRCDASALMLRKETILKKAKRGSRRGTSLAVRFVLMAASQSSKGVPVPEARAGLLHSAFGANIGKTRVFGCKMLDIKQIRHYAGGGRSPFSPVACRFAVH